MSEFKILKKDGVVLNNPVAIIGFPTIGLVGSILASYISKEKNMTFIAGITSPELPPYALIQNGEPFPPIRMYSSRGDDGNDIVVVTSEITPKPELCYDLTMRLLEVLGDLGVKRIIALEGVAQYDGTGIIVCGTNKETVEASKGDDVTVLNDGLVRGITGILLYEGRENNVDILALLCPASPNMPDPRASATIIGPLTRIVPGLGVDVGPLIKEAEEMESKIHQEIQNEQNDDIRQIYG